MLFVFHPGEIQHYDEHLFTLAEDEGLFERRSEIDCRVLRLEDLSLVCYDLRSPFFSRNVENYDLLIYVASWPKSKIKAWDTCSTFIEDYL
jgi:predicted amidohydrolase